jgi:hypothetical protein
VHVKRARGGARRGKAKLDRPVARKAAAASAAAAPLALRGWRGLPAPPQLLPAPLPSLAGDRDAMPPPSTHSLLRAGAGAAVWCGSEAPAPSVPSVPSVPVTPELLPVPMELLP